VKAAFFIGLTFNAPSLFAEKILPYATVQYHQGTATLHSNSRRSLAGIIYTLWQEFGMPLSFEDAPLKFKGDFEDITVPTYRPKSPSDRLLVPRGGTLDFPMTISSQNKPTSDIGTVLQQLLGSYSAAGYPGSYTTLEREGVWHIIPSGAKNAQGVIVAVTPLMESHIHLNERKGRTNSMVLDEMLDQIRASRHRTIFVGSSLGKDFLEAIREDPFDGSARELLENVFKRLKGHSLWILNCTPMDGPCSLNIY
jgi:hypothetical protein